MTTGYPPGRYHQRAHSGVRHWLEAKAVAPYGAYMVGMALPPHRNGLRKIAVLILDDGTLLGACANPGQLSPNIHLTSLFPRDFFYLSYREEFLEYRHNWYESLDGYRGFHDHVQEFSTVELATRLLTASHDSLEILWQWTAEADQMTPEGLRDEASLPDLGGQAGAACLAQEANVVSVEGVAWSAAHLAMLGIRGWLVRELLISPLPPEFLTGAATEEIASAEPTVIDLLRSAATIASIDRRGQVALHRTAAELLLNNFDVPFSNGRFSTRLDELNKRWEDNPPIARTSGDPRPSEAREKAWRAAVIAEFHTIRDIGNQLHALLDVSEAEGERCCSALCALIEKLAERDHWG